MRKIIEATAYPDFTVELTFDNGASGRIDVKPRLHGPVFAPLRDPDMFAQATVDKFGALCWPNSADLSPDALYADLLMHGQL